MQHNKNEQMYNYHKVSSSHTRMNSKGKGKAIPVTGSGGP
jgi:hypothetical protein